MTARPGPGRPRGQIDLTFLCFATIVFVALCLRLPNLEWSPGWWLDEGLYLDVAWNAAHGQARLGPVNHTWVSPFQTAPPLHPLLSGFWMRASAAVHGFDGPDLLSFRRFSALCGILTVIGAYGLGLLWRVPLVALLAAAILAVDPWTVMYHRLGLHYNLLALEVVALLLTAHAYFEEPRPRRLIRPVVIASLAPLTVYYGVAVPIALWIAVLVAGRPRDAWLPPLALLPIALFLAWLWHWNPPGLHADWKHFRHDAITTWQLTDWLRDFRDLFTVTPLVPLGLLGLAVLPRRGTVTLLQILTLVYLFIWLRRPGSLVWIRRPDLDLAVPGMTYPLIPLQAPLALGAAALCLNAWRHFRGDAVDGAAPGSLLRLRVATAITVLIIGGALALLTVSSLRAIWRQPDNRFEPHDDWGFHSVIASELAVQRDEIEGPNPLHRGVAPFLWSQRVSPEELVIAEYSLWWRLPGRHATLAQAIAHTGGRADFYTYPLPPERWAYSADWRSARFIVLDEATRRWRTQIDPNLRDVVHEIQRTWVQVFARGRLKVYAPRRAAHDSLDVDALMEEVERARSSGRPWPVFPGLTSVEASP